MPGCDARISDEALIAYWAGDTSAGEVEATEAHLFGCEDCTARLGALASLQAGVSALARSGRVWGQLTRSLMNRLQRDGVRLRTYTLEPGETLPCAVHPGDELVVTVLRADFSDSPTVKLTITSSATEVPGVDEVVVLPGEREIFVAMLGRRLRQLPSLRLDLTLTSAADATRVLGEYALEHSALPNVTDPLA